MPSPSPAVRLQLDRESRDRAMRTARSLRASGASKTQVSLAANLARIISRRIARQLRDASRARRQLTLLTREDIDVLNAIAARFGLVSRARAYQMQDAGNK